MTQPGRRDLERDLEAYEEQLEREYQAYEEDLARVYARQGAGAAEDEDAREPSMADDLIDQLLPERVDWRRLVGQHPWPAVGLAALGGYLLGRSRGTAVIAALSAFAANAVADGVNEALGEDVL